MSLSKEIRKYRSAGVTLMQKACEELFPKDGIRVLFSVLNGYGYYCIRKSGKKADKAYIDKLSSRVYELAEGEYEIQFDQYEEGFVIWFPEYRGQQLYIPTKLFKTLKKTIKWGNLVGMSTISDLNNVIARAGTRNIILMQEAQSEARIAAVAQKIAETEGAKFVMIAGPSSSGKTTFSHRLSIQLLSMGITPHPVALDDYYLNREDVPVGEDGKRDYESINSLDTERFNNDMQSLLAGNETELPVFNFKLGKRADSGRMLKLGKDDVLVIEGINGLNDALSHSLPKESKFKIYISALNTLSISDYEPMSTSDVRLLRRIVRDARVRNTNAKRTLSMWPSVRRGERENIFPFQNDADVMFNSALIYELAVIKLYAEPLLMTINEYEKEYEEAQRLLALLKQVYPMPTEDIPNNSLMREFIGGGCFGV